MAKILKPYEVLLDADLAREILNIPFDGAVEGNTPRTIGERVDAATKAVEEANDYLLKSALAGIVADTLMRKLKKRGTPSIRVRPDGTVILHVAYDDDDDRPKVKPAAVVRSPRVSKLPKLPKLVDLRKEAKRLGVDLSDLGQKRRAIYDRIELARNAKASKDNGKVEPPARMIDEATETEAPVRPKVIRRPKGVVIEELDVDELLSPDRLR